MAVYRLPVSEGFSIVVGLSSNSAATGLLPESKVILEISCPDQNIEQTLFAHPRIQKSLIPRQSEEEFFRIKGKDLNEVLGSLIDLINEHIDDD